MHDLIEVSILRSSKCVKLVSFYAIMKSGAFSRLGADMEGLDRQTYS